MRRIIPVVIVVITLTAAFFALTAMETVSATETETMAEEQIDMEAAKATFEATCAKCHSLKRPLGKKKDQTGWEKTITRMSSYHTKRWGKAIGEEDQKVIVQHLLSVAGK